MREGRIQREGGDVIVQRRRSEGSQTMGLFDYSCDKADYSPADKTVLLVTAYANGYWVSFNLLHEIK